MVMSEVTLGRFETPAEVREFEKGKFELVHAGGMTIGRVTYEPGWKWSTHVGALTGAGDEPYVSIPVMGAGEYMHRGSGRL